ncbi:MAG: type II secretion system F family protein [Gammaproteobacteria bacterium]|nr:type II secretion system F family protein [Gammaproteobacteria bacterium]MCI0590113.1 type II secretion system F family protein [Gammaproteobacteria bacterium]
MPIYHYKGRSRRGDLIQGDIDAGSSDAVATQLFNTGITPIDIAEKVRRQDKIGKAMVRLGKAPDLTELALFSRQMYTLLRSGVPITKAMVGLISSTGNQKLVDTLKDIQASLESGRDLSSALARHTQLFSTLYVSMVRVGENTGRLDEAFLRIAQFLEFEKDTRDRIKTALRYPMFVMIAIAIAVSVINVFVIPAFAKVFERQNVPLPWPTRVILGASDFTVTYWPVILVGLAILIVAAQLYIKTEQGRYNWDKFKLTIPIIGSIIKRATLARFARSFSMALASGVPLVQALTVVAKGVDNEYVGDHILRMRNGIERGETLTRTAAVTDMFTPMVLQMIAVGEETGSVDELLSEVAGFYEREVDLEIKNLSAAIEPVLITAIGVIVLILALGVFLPMWDLASVKLGGAT